MSTPTVIVSPVSRTVVARAPGIPGPAGANGTNGTNGTNGAAGANGTNGTNGTDGAAGVQGPPGTPAVTPTVRQTYVTAGSVVFGSDASWTRYPAIELSIPAAIGDWVQFWMGGMWHKSSSDFLDLAVVVGTTLVRYSSTGTGTPALEGAPDLYPDTGFVHIGAPFAFEVEAGDLDGGIVRVTVAHKGTPGGGTLYADTNYPLRVLGLNLHTVN